MEYIALPLVIVMFLTWHNEVLATIPTIGFNKKDCDVYRHYLYTEADKFIVEWNGDTYPKYCTLRFKVMKEDYKLCANVKRFQFDCFNDLKFYWGVSMNVKRYSCGDSLPIQYCDDDGLIFMHIEPQYKDIRTTSSSLRIEVSPVYIGNDSSSSSSSGGIIAGIVVCVLLFMIICCAVRYKRKMAQKEACNDLRYLGSAAGRQDGSEQLAPNNTNQQGRYSPVPTQQNQPPGQQFSSYLPYGQQSLAGPPVGQQYPAAQPPGQGYPMSGQPAPSAPPLEQQYQSYGQYPVGQQLSDQVPEIQNPSTGGASSPYNTSHQEGNYDPPPSYSSVMGKM